MCMCRMIKISYLHLCQSLELDMQTVEAQLQLLHKIYLTIFSQKIVKQTAAYLQFMSVMGVRYANTLRSSTSTFTHLATIFSQKTAQR